MPVSPTYPGVYIEEVPSTVRTITGVATSITAFVGRAQRGPVDDPVAINSFPDFERRFGGLWKESTLGFAVRDFYRNGGSQAIIVRLARSSKAATLSLSSGTEEKPDNLELEAANAGAWGNELRARVDHDVSEEVAEDQGLSETDLFNLTVYDGTTGATEHFRNVSVKEGPRRVDKVLEQISNLAHTKGSLSKARPRPHEKDPEAGKGIWDDSTKPTNTKATAQSGDDGDPLDENSFIGTGLADEKKGLYALEKADLFNLLCIPPYKSGGDIDTTLVGTAAKYCEDRRAMLLVDPLSSWRDKDAAKKGLASVGTKSKNAALFFPRLREANPLKDNQVEEFVPCGAMAGVFARTDTQRGVWKAPAGLDATLVGVTGLSVPLTDAENGELNPLAINCLRVRPAAGPVVWGSRTLRGDDRLASEWKYIPVRRLALFLEDSLYRGTQWVVFEPNDEPLWAQIRLNVGAFMHNLFRLGAFQGTTPKDAYLVKVDSETTTQKDVNLGIVNIVVGFAPLKPAEFVILKIQQLAGQIAT